MSEATTATAMVASEVLFVFFGLISGASVGHVARMFVDPPDVIPRVVFSTTVQLFSLNVMVFIALFSHEESLWVVSFTFEFSWQ